MNVGDLYQIAIAAQDVEASTRFYRDQLGLQLIKKFDSPVKLTFFNLGGVRLMIELGSGGGESVFYLKVSNLDETLNSLRQSGVETEAEPHAIYLYR